MKLANIVPTSCLGAIPRNQTTHLALSNLILDNDTYFRFYRKQVQRGHTVILDNPVHEDTEIDPEDWLMAVAALKPTITVVPDVIDDSDATVQNANKLALRAKEAHPGVKLMVVPHGFTQDDWYSCARSLFTVPGVDYFGISLERRLKDDSAALQRRVERLRKISLNESFDAISVHLLGTSEGGNEFAEPYRFRRAVSCDSSKFAVFYLCGRPIEPTPLGYITDPYPGREPFGGSMKYFEAEPSLPVGGLRRMRKNLALWCEFAERKTY